jgi:hypothetical protein
MESKAMLPGDYLEQPVVCSAKSIILISFISKDSVPVQASSWIFVVWLAQLGETISYSVFCDIPIHFMYSRCHVSLLSLVFISIRIIVTRLTPGHSKLAIEFDP